MNITFTEDQLILFIYGEADNTVSNEINEALLTDNSLQKKYKELLLIINQLAKTSFHPHDTSVSIIMEESALSQREEIY